MAYGLTYSYNSTSKSYSVKGYSSIGTNDKVVIPSTYDGPNGSHPVTSISNGAFSQCTSLTSIIIPNSVTSIGSGAFSQCTSLTSIIIPNSVTIIDEGTFSHCSNLTSVHIPNSVTIIRQSAFEYCSSLTGVTIPDSVTDIEINTFYDCTSLKQLILLPSTPPTISSAAIPSTVQSIYVQQSSKAAYKAATNWTTFASKIISDDMYLSLAQFNQKNKEYIESRLSLLDVYPVGSIYLSVNSTSPATLFGGVWERIQDKFLLGASNNYSAGIPGGEATHTLTINEMPKHSHDVIADGNKKYVGYNSGNAGNYVRNDYNDTGNIGNQYTTDKVGGGQPHNNMPPFLAVYMWKRKS